MNFFDENITADNSSGEPSSDDSSTKGLVAVVGAGQMGSGIAQVFATNGYSVKVYDLSLQIFAKSQQRIMESLQKLFEKQLICKNPEVILGRISYKSEIRDLADCSIVLESAFEDFSIKETIFRELSTFLKPNTFVASNTSSYSITALSQLIPYHDQFVGFHFMNPPPIMELVEVVQGLYTSEKTFTFFWNLAKELGKTPIASQNSPGFVLNRILIPMINDAIAVLYEGVSTTDQIDTAMKLGANHPIGPLALADLIGLDTILAIMTTLQKELDEEKYAPCPLLKEYVEKGWLGKKKRKGFYEYTDEKLGAKACIDT